MFQSETVIRGTFISGGIKGGNLFVRGFFLKITILDSYLFLLETVIRGTLAKYKYRSLSSSAVIFFLSLADLSL